VVVHVQGHRSSPLPAFPSGLCYNGSIIHLWRGSVHLWRTARVKDGHSLLLSPAWHAADPAAMLYSCGEALHLGGQTLIYAPENGAGTTVAR
jgi:hypothetical protein